MVHSSEELHGAQRQIEELQVILDEMRQEETPQSYAILCISYVLRIRQIQEEIEEYLGIKEIATEEIPA
jgi:hypothetical protein